MCRIGSPWAVAVAVVALHVSGCGSDGKVRVNGVVTLDNTPVEGAIVTFHPVDQSQGKIAHATTDKGGGFQLGTTKSDDGAFPGEYKVTVGYAEGAEPPAAKGLKDAFTGFEKAQGQKAKPPKYRIPAQFSDPAKSPLTQKVPADGQVVLALKSK